MCVESGVCEVFSFFANSHQCFLQGGNLRAVHNEDAVSGPAKCPSIPHVRARAWADQLPGEIAAESKAAMDAIEKVPAPYLILACLLMLVLMVFCIMRCCRSQGKGKKPAGKWHKQALYLPIAEDEDDQGISAPGAREVRSRTEEAGSEVVQGAQAPWSPPDAFGFHGPEKLSWRQPGAQAL
ncbi:unnamed protein product [Durusdinium trenchii]|uniref:Apple domain-containing protein n=1 Tax=Durusdinium trenchii TaxID=1381693 RepID=A0ABP0P507_9DINO